MVSIQVKIVGDFCNKRCTYCRDRDFDQGNKEVMSFVTLKNLINSLSKMSAPRQRMHWLGGEPLLAGLSFFEEVVRLQSEFPNVTWVNTIQTNAMLINENWAHFFEKQRFNVGVSVDGSKETHDTDRLTAGGLGSYDRVMNGVENLRRHNINPSVICVVTKKNANYGAVMLSSLVEAGFKKIAFNAFYNTATDFAGDVFAVDDNSWLKFLKDIFQEWVRINRSDIQVREIEEMLAWTKGRRANSCTFSGNCARCGRYPKNGTPFLKLVNNTRVAW
jgi:uncharacterized protein